MILILLLGGIVCGTLSVIDLTRSITGPVGRLVAVNKKVAKGDLTQRVDIRSNDEFGILGEAFNEMIAQRRQAEETLRQAHDQLEQQVEDRTADLVKTNQELQQARDVALEATQAKSFFLARAMVWDPAVLLLDEATAAVDSASEAAFRAALRTSVLDRGRAVLTVAHRLAVAQEADRVLVMDAGQIVESGRPEELIRRGGRFAALLELEAAGWDWQTDGQALRPSPGK